MPNLLKGKGLIVCGISDERLRSSLAAALKARFGANRILEKSDLSSTLETLVAKDEPDAVIVDHPAHSDATFRLIRGLRSEIPVCVLLNAPLSEGEFVSRVNIIGKFGGSKAVEQLVACLCGDPNQAPPAAVPAVAPQPQKPTKQEARQPPATAIHSTVPAGSATAGGSRPTITELQEKLDSAVQSKSSKVDIGLVTAAQEATVELVKRAGLTEQAQTLIKTNVAVVVKSVSNNQKLKNVLAQITLNPEKYRSSHSIALSQLSCAVAAAVEWGSNTTFQKLTLASFLHDISVEIEELAEAQTRMELDQLKTPRSKEEIKRYLLHPSIAAELARKFDEVPPDVDIIVSQHHERPDGSGFPRGLTASQFHPLSAVFIIAHELLTEIHRTGKQPSLEQFAASRAEKYSTGNFKKVIRGLQKTKTE